MASPSRVWAFSRTSSSSRAACQVARSTMGGRPGSALVGSLDVVVMVSSVVSRAGQRRARSYDGHQNGLAARPELIAAGAVGVGAHFALEGHSGRWLWLTGTRMRR